MEKLNIVLEKVGAEPVYDTKKDGKPVFVGYRVTFSPAILSQEEYVRLSALPPYEINAEIKEE